jgi:hypothetical protein
VVNLVDARFIDSAEILDHLLAWLAVYAVTLHKLSTEGIVACWAFLPNGYRFIAPIHHDIATVNNLVLVPDEHPLA